MAATQVNLNTTILPPYNNTSQSIAIRNGRAYLAELSKRQTQKVQQIIADFKNKHDVAVKKKKPEKEFKELVEKTAQWLTKHKRYDESEWLDSEYNFYSEKYNRWLVYYEKIANKKLADRNNVIAFLEHQRTLIRNGEPKLPIFCAAVAKQGRIKAPGVIEERYAEKAKKANAGHAKTEPQPQAIAANVTNSAPASNPTPNKPTTPVIPPSITTQTAQIDNQPPKAQPPVTVAKSPAPSIPPKVQTQQPSVTVSNQPVQSVKAKKSKKSSIPMATPTHNVRNKRSRGCCRTILNALSKIWNAMKRLCCR